MHLVIITPAIENSGIGQYGNLMTSQLYQSTTFTNITVLTERLKDHSNKECKPGLNIEGIWERDDPFAGIKILTRLRNIKPDIIWNNIAFTGFSHSSLINVINLFSLSFIYHIKCPSVITLHELVEQADLKSLGFPNNMATRWLVKLLTLAIMRSDVICVTLRRNAELLVKLKPKAHILHIPHGTFEQPELLPETNQKSILVSTMLAPFKGIDILISACKELYLNDSALRLTITGAEHPRFPGYLKYLKNKYCDVPFLFWAGYVPDEELKNSFSQSTAVVVPYLASSGTPGTILRAVSWGRTVIASDLDEIKAISKEQELKINFFSTGDYQDLSRTLSIILSNASLRQKQTKHNYDISLRSLTPKHICNSYIQAFEIAMQEF